MEDYQNLPLDFAGYMYIILSEGDLIRKEASEKQQSKHKGERVKW